MLCVSRQDCVPSRRVRRSPPLLWTREEPCTRHSRQSHAHAAMRELPLLSPTWKKGTHTQRKRRRGRESLPPPADLDYTADRFRLRRQTFSIPPPTVLDSTADRSRVHRRTFSTPPPHGLNSTAARSKLHRRPFSTPPPTGRIPPVRPHRYMALTRARSVAFISFAAHRRMRYRGVRGGGELQGGPSRFISEVGGEMTRDMLQPQQHSKKEDPPEAQGKNTCRCVRLAPRGISFQICWGFIDLSSLND